MVKLHSFWFPNNSFLLSENTPQHPLQWEAVSPKRTTGLATTSIFLVCFLEKLISLPGGKINNPSLGRMLSFVPPRDSLERHIELIMHNSRPLKLMHCFHNSRDTRTISILVSCSVQRSQDTVDNN